MSGDVGPLVAYCKGCKTLFTHGSGKYLDHLCRRADYSICEEGIREERVRLEFIRVERVDNLSDRHWKEHP